MSLNESEYFSLSNEIERSVCHEHDSVIAPFPTQVLCSDEDLPRAIRTLDGLSKFPTFLNIVAPVAPKQLLITGDFRALIPTIALAARDHLSYEQVLRLVQSEDNVRFFSQGIGGCFNATRDRIVINLSYMGSIGDVSETFPGVPDFSNKEGPLSIMAGREEMPTALLVHELSHVIDHRIVKCGMASRELRSLLEQTSTSARRSGRTVTEYAASDKSDSDAAEWFAETMTAYLYWPDALKDFDSMSHLAMKSALEELSACNKN
jgi:hypothetical protein